MRGSKGEGSRRLTWVPLGRRRVVRGREEEESAVLRLEGREDEEVDDSRDAELEV